MDFNIKVEDYLTKEEIKQICINKLNSIIDRDPERILGNIAYYNGYGVVDSLLTEEQKQIIRNRTTEIVNDLKEYTIFRDRNYWHDKTSVAQTILERAVKDSEDAIRNKVEASVSNFNPEKIVEEEGLRLFQEMLYEKLTKKE